MSDDRDAQRSVAEHKEAKRAEKNDTNDDRDTISIDKNKIYAFLKSPRAQWGIVLILLLLILSSSYGIRTSNIDRLVDVTNGENIPLALDPFYFMRVAQTYVDNGGTMPEYDPLRYNPERPTEWHSEIHPYIVANMFLVTQTFNPDITLEYMYVLSPALFYLLGLILFFCICVLLTKDKWLALLASAFLAFTPAFLYRTMAGFADHESVGMMGFFLVLLVYILSVNNVGRKKDHYVKALIFGALTGIVTTLVFALWGGIIRFVILILPISLFLIWIFNTRKKNKKFMYAYLTYYTSWIVFSILSAPLLNQSMKRVMSLFTGSEGIIAPAILLFMVIDTIYALKKFSFVKQKIRIVYSLATTGILGIVGLIATGENPLSFVSSIFTRLLRPIGFGRFGSTVAENQSPYLSQWIAQSGDVIFWLFVFGTILLGYQITKKVKNLKRRWTLLLLYALMIIGIIFSKYSPSSMFNGESFVSVLFYFVPLMVFWIYFFFVYTKEDFKMTKMETVIFAWMFIVIISGRGAARVFFTITPGVVFLSSYFVFTSLKECKVSKDKVLKIAFLLFFIFSLIFSLVTLNESHRAIANAAQGTGPSAHIQWQQAMSWVRDNTPEDSVFVHWWDYGYWVESLGQRRTVADGGHFQGSEDGNHKIGRYVLTTQNPDTALSYFKSMNIDYLLIDPTELGKYSAYSRIGSDTQWDRFSIIPTGQKDPRYTTESKNRTIDLFNIQGAVDEDIYYVNSAGTEIFLPGPSYTVDGTPSFKSYLGGVYMPSDQNTLFAPEGIFVYNNVQHRIPIRYVYFSDRLFDFGEGLDAVVYLVPSIQDQGGGQISVDPMGGIIYLSPKVSKTLYAQLYLLDDAFNNYPTVELAHMQNSPVVDQLRAFNSSAINEFVFFHGFQGPIKIWKTNYPEDTQVVPEFYEFSTGEFGSIDRYFEEPETV